MPSLVFIEKNAMLVPLFMNTGDVVGDAPIPWKPSADDLVQLSRDELVQLHPYSDDIKKRQTKDDIAEEIVQLWSETLIKVGTSQERSFFVKKGGRGGYGDDRDQDKDDDNDDKDDFDNPVLPPETFGDDFGITVQKGWIQEFKNFNINPSFTVMMLKAMIAMFWNINVRAQRLVFNNVVLEDHFTFEMMGITSSVVIYLFIQGVAGASQKRRFISLTDLKVKNDDLDGVKKIFALEAFNSRGWLLTLDFDTVKEYLKELEGRKSTPQQISSTVERIIEYKTVKDWFEEKTVVQLHNYSSTTT